MNRLLALALLGGLMALARWAPLGELLGLHHQATVSLGFILISGFLAGHLVTPLQLPRITGYILAGILFGPYAAGLLRETVVLKLQLIDDLALALIAFTAGGELQIRRLRPRIRSILSITAVQMVVVFTGIVAVALVLVPRSSLFASTAGFPVVAVALLVGTLGVANSPATAVALINETRSRGSFTDTILGVTVIKDVLVLVLITALLPLVRVLAMEGETFSFRFVQDLAWSIGGSLAGGALLGLLVTLYMRGVGAVLPLFIVGVSILVSQVARQFHLEALLLCMVAGFVIENATPYGERFIRAIERSSLPVYVVFFAIGGAALDLGALRAAWGVTLILFLVRIALIWAGTTWGEMLGGGGDSRVKRMGWTGFVAQAGVTLGIASIVGRKFPEWGPALKVVALALIAANQLLGPITFRIALLRSGEAGRSREAGRPSQPAWVHVRIVREEAPGEGVSPSGRGVPRSPRSDR